MDYRATLVSMFAGRVRAGITCCEEILAAIRRLGEDGPPRWHSRDEVMAEVLRVTQRYLVATFQGALQYELVGRTTLNHGASSGGGMSSTSHEDVRRRP